MRREFWPSRRHDKPDQVAAIIRNLSKTFDGWDAVRTADECRHCRGTGMADEYNECGFCE